MARRYSKRSTLVLLASNHVLKLRATAIEIAAGERLTLEFKPRLREAFINLIRIFPEGEEEDYLTLDAGGANDRQWVTGAGAMQVWDAQAPSGSLTDKEGRFYLDNIPFGVQSFSMHGEKLATQQLNGLSYRLNVAATSPYEFDLFVNPSVSSLTLEVVDVIDGEPIENAGGLVPKCIYTMDF